MRLMSGTFRRLRSAAGGEQWISNTPVPAATVAIGLWLVRQAGDVMACRAVLLDLRRMWGSTRAWTTGPWPNSR